MSDVACVVLDWKRPFNMKKVIAGIKSQSMETQLYVVHIENDRQYEDCININIDRNFGPGVKFGIMSMIPEPYTVVQDDDMQMTNPQYIEFMYHSCKTKDFVGTVGLIFGSISGKSYTSGEKIYSPEVDTPVDVILANMFMIKTELAASVWTSNLSTIRELQYRDFGFITNEDCIMCALWKEAGLKTPHVVGNLDPQYGERPYIGLDARFGLEHDPDHYDRRNQTCQFFLERNQT